ncbi:hypothetical protein [Hydrogenophaga sp. PAMC20947]|uniref:hypothetical protein n=1 Tax=Hydrogenophaga sp. PAMC20947 TaxID=2565558 RepID=UPI00109E068E|nr:hypothetical protein [Hydrogenophaga sp. PAMC20947]QCB46889.1 hypothetical protein E5678_13170 [Hydrogenophaga sp. PAMC20947]
MKHSLLDHRPVIDALEGPQRLPLRLASPAVGNEMWIATELLEHAEEGELESYLTQLVARISGRHRAADVDTALARILTRVGRPMLQQRSTLTRASSGRAFGIELEGLSPEDQAFELARHFARFATDAAHRAGRAHGPASAQQVAQRAAGEAARRFAPGLAPVRTGNRPLMNPFFRRGRSIDALNP